MLRRLAAWEVLLPLAAVCAVAVYLGLNLAAFSHKAAAIGAALVYLGFALWLSGRPREIRMMLFFCEVAALAGLYAAEIYVAHQKQENTSLVREAARLRRAGEIAWPAIPPATWYFDFFRADIDAGRSPLPLAGLSNVKSVLCIEASGWVSFQADRFGFRNPPRPAGEESVDVIMVGDSFTQGTCLPDDQTIATHLRQAGLSILNLGMHGSGPLFELAILKEYAARPRAKRIVWFFFEGNDIIDLRAEADSAPLRRYLDGAWTQGLEKRQAEIDAAIQAGLGSRREGLMWGDVARLKELRTRLGLSSVGVGGELRPPVEPYLPLLGQILDHAAQFAKAKGAAFSLVYIPAPDRYQDHAAYFGDMEREVSALACRAGIDLLSMTRVFAGSREPLAHYVRLGSRYGHFNADGYRVTVDAVRRRIAGETQSDCPTR